VRSGRELLDTVLIAEATTYDTWIALNLVASGAGDGVPRDDLRRNLVQALAGANETAAIQLLAQLERLGFVQILIPASGELGARVALTPAGNAEYQRLLASVNAASARALAGIDPEDVATTIRVLGQFREGAAAATH
jgi:hypothetical protein